MLRLEQQMKPYLSAAETIRRMVAVRGAWARRQSRRKGCDDARQSELLARLNHACMEPDRLRIIAKIVFHGPEFSGRIPTRLA